MTFTDAFEDRKSMETVFFDFGEMKPMLQKLEAGIRKKPRGGLGGPTGGKHGVNLHSTQIPTREYPNERTTH